MDVIKNKEYVSYKYMDKFKGLLIILIIYGHIKGLTSTETQNALYTFHVSSFLFLPFLFNTDKFNYTNILKIFRRYYTPYIVFFTIAFLAYFIFINSTVDIYKIFTSFIVGTPYLLRESIGISTYWFFPALIFLLITLMIYNSLNKNMKTMYLVVMLCTHLFIGLYSLPHSDILRYAPFDLYIALYLFSIGYIIKFIIQNFEINNIQFFLIIILFITLIYISYGGRFNLASPFFPNLFNNPLELLLRDGIMITGFFSLLYLSKFFPVLSIFGKYSLGIYTIHPLLIQALAKVNNSEILYVLIIKLFIVALLSLAFTMLVYKFNFNKLIYPR